MLKFLNKLKPVSFALAGLLALCLSGTALAGSPVLDRVVKNGVLKVAMSGDQPPFNAVSRDKSVIGFDVDLERDDIACVTQPGRLFRNQRAHDDVFRSHELRISVKRPRLRSVSSRSFTCGRAAPLAASTPWQRPS